MDILILNMFTNSLKVKSQNWELKILTFKVLLYLRERKIYSKYGWNVNLLILVTLKNKV